MVLSLNGVTPYTLSKNETFQDLKPSSCELGNFTTCCPFSVYWGLVVQPHTESRYFVTKSTATRLLSVLRANIHFKWGLIVQPHTESQYFVTKSTAMIGACMAKADLGFS